jgi:spore maturation protein CgeB
MKILYAAGLSPNDSSLDRLWALERLGHSVLPFNACEYESPNKIVRKVAYRLSAGLGPERLNHDLLKIAEVARPNVFGADKPLWMKSKTLEKLRGMELHDR